MERIAIKLLSDADLTFFDAIFKSRSIGGNQKAINLNARVFTKLFYPDLGRRAEASEIEVPVQVTVFGPGDSHPYQFFRSITKRTKSYKNWRLNGAAVPDPEDEPGRFDVLTADDIAVMEFRGSPDPTAVSLFLISAANDPDLHVRFRPLVSRGVKSMVPMQRSWLEQVALDLALPDDHFFRSVLQDPELDELLEEVARGDEPARREFRARTTRRLSQGELLQARERAEKIGLEGERLAYDFLKDHLGVPVTWTSQHDAAASWDFESDEAAPRRYDAKSTTGPFDRHFHISTAELAAAADPDVPYHILRVFDLSDAIVMFCESDPINDFASQLLDACSKLPAGVRPDGFSVDPGALTWRETHRQDRSL